VAQRKFKIDMAISAMKVNVSQPRRQMGVPIETDK